MVDLQNHDCVNRTVSLRLCSDTGNQQDGDDVGSECSVYDGSPVFWVDGRVDNNGDGRGLVGGPPGA